MGHEGVAGEGGALEREKKTSCGAGLSRGQL